VKRILAPTHARHAPYWALRLRRAALKSPLIFHPVGFPKTASTVFGKQIFYS
jgi:hypothetical protein